MQMKDVVISVTGVHSGRHGPDTMQLITAGQYGVEHDKIRMTWAESEIEGMEGTRTTITVLPGSVLFTRKGEVNTEMEFEEGERHYFLYETPLGEHTMGVNTRRIRKQLDIHGGEMEIEYTVDMNQSIVGRSRFFIRVEEPKKSHTGDIRWPI